jgi:group II intron reverse transcriptase/maturase
MEDPTLTKLALISRRARGDSKFQFTSLAHHLNVEFLRGCYRSIGKDKACGIDGRSWREYGQDLDENLADLVERLKAKRYKPLPAKRVYIPKNDKETRPLGLPAIEDKIVQKGIARILEAIYEPDFMNCSYGFRPKRSCHQALKAVNDTIMFKPVSYIIEADIKGFFDHVSHDWMMKFLEVRIGDSSLLLLIRRFLKAGYMESGMLMRTDRGTPQGGNLSPMLANIFLHYVLDLWFVKRVQGRVRGKCYLVRYADDFVCMVQYRHSAVEVERMLRERFAKFGLSLHPEKTRTISFGRFERENARREGRRAETFDFLGFTHYCGLSREGKFLLGRKTSGKKFRKACTEFYNWLRRNRNVMAIKELWRTLAAKLRGHYNYYGVSGNWRMIANFGYLAVRAVYKWLNRRGQCKSFTWENLTEYLTHYRLPPPRIVHNFYQPSPSSEIG